jgi:hypothetical protein
MYLIKKQIKQFYKTVIEKFEFLQNTKLYSNNFSGSNVWLYSHFIKFENRKS